MTDRAHGIADVATRMRAVVQHGPEDLRLEEQPVPDPGPGEVLVRVRANGICGSDLHAWREAIWGRDIVLGHEIAGEVVGLGEGVGGIETGTTGAIYGGIPCGSCSCCTAGLSHYCRDGHGLGSSRFGGLGEYLLAPATSVLPAPAGTDPAAIAFAEPLANGLRCLDFPEVADARSALVIGAGPIGLSCLIAARVAGVERIWVVEGRERRAKAALALGAERVLHPSNDDVRNAVRDVFPNGCDLVVEAVGRPETIQSAFRFARPGGDVVLMGVCTGTVEVRPLGWLLRELTIRSSVGCSREDQRRALALLVDGEVDGSMLVSRRVALDEAIDSIRDLASGADEIKVVVEHA